MGRRGCMRNLGRNSRSRGQHLRDSVHAGGNPSLTNPLSVQDSIKDDFRCPITRPDTGGEDGQSYKLCAVKLKRKRKRSKKIQPLCTDSSPTLLTYVSREVQDFKTVEFLKHREEVLKLIIGLKVRLSYKISRPQRVVGLTALNAKDITLLDGNEETSLVKYFKEKHGRDIAYQDVPVVILSAMRDTFIPMEFCMVVKQQSCRDAKQQYNRISVRQSEHISTQRFKRDGLDCLSHSVNNSMTVATGRVILPPSLKLDGNLSVEGKPVEHWAILDFTGDEHDNLTNFIEAIRHIFTGLGINMEQPLKIFRLENSDSLRELLCRIKTINGRRLQLLLCIMSKNNKVYKLLKFLAETEIGIVTQCCRLTPYNVRSSAFLTSLAHKINVKMGGRNVDEGLLPFFDYEEHVMLIGADVNHPASKDCRGSPSIAAVVATVNWPATNKYVSRISVQEGQCEKISNFGEICFDLVGNYEKLNYTKPKKIIVFRDGVSREEYSMVLNEELEDLKRVFGGFHFHPTITVVVAVKGHRSRFFPMSPNDGDVTSTLLPGTVVDTVLTDPSEFAFFLYSQSRIQATSKPTRYHVLWDENNFCSDELQRLIYALCFSSPRCNEAVRLIPPVHYADLAAYRGRQYFDAMEFSQPIHSDASSSSSTVSNSNVPQLLKLHPDMENIMYFV